MRVLIIVGTRPEAIKFAPLIKVLQGDTFFDVKICSTGQHREMLAQVFDFFEIKADIDLSLMKPGQDLFDISAAALQSLKTVLNDLKPDVVFVQGDTTTAFIGALASFYFKIPVAHLEAGLRSGNKYSPFPEEINRKLIGIVAEYHFAPTPRALNSLKTEGTKDNVWMVGNTVVDALLLGLDILKNRGTDFSHEFPQIDFNKRIILVTAHRRESFGEPFEDICAAIATVAAHRPETCFIYPVHLNPNVREPVSRLLSNLSNVHLVEPTDYQRLIWLMKKSEIVLTDSGGIQEEAPVLGKPVLVMREVTERVEGIEAGTARLVGTDRENIISHINRLLDNEQGMYENMAKAVNPYGDGTTSTQIATILKAL